MPKYLAHHPLTLTKRKTGPRKDPPSDQILQDADEVLAMLKSGELEIGREVPYIPANKRLSREDEEILADRVHRFGDVDARNTLVKHNVGLIYMMIESYRRQIQPRDMPDTIQAGYLGLLRATETFNPNLGWRFSTYAVAWVRMKISRQVFAAKRATMLPIDGGAMERIAGMRVRQSHQILSLDHVRGGNEDDDFEGAVDAEQISQEAAVISEQNRKLVRAALEKICADSKNNARMRIIIDNRFLTDEPETLRQIGLRVGVSGESIRVIEDQIKNKLKQILGATNA